jgi:hypothetical protein
MRDRYGAVYLLPAALAFVGQAILVSATHGGFFPFALAWCVVSVVIALIGSRAARIGVTVLLIPICVLTTFEGGLFMLPAAVSILVIDAVKASAGPSTTAA